MSYIRGDNYLWSDGERLHIWVADGYDSWDEAAWAVEENGKRHEAQLNASGVGVPEDIMDQFAVMRFAELIDKGALSEVMQRALIHRGNGGAEALVKNAEKLKAFSIQS